MPSILTIDGGTTTGWAHWRDGMPKPRGNTVIMPDVDRIGRFMNAFADWMMPFAKMEGVDQIVVEAPIIHDHGGRGVNIYEVDKNFGIVHAVEAAADRLEIPCMRISRGKVAAHFAGKGSGTRKQLKTACLLNAQRCRGWNVKSEDIADALAVLDWYAFTYNIPVPWDCRKNPFPFTGDGELKLEGGGRG